VIIPAWMARVGVDIKVIGLFTLAQAPWTFQLLWSPSMDRYSPPFLGRKRGWILLCQVALLVLGLGSAGVSDHPEAVWVIGAFALAIAFASASQDVAIDLTEKRFSATQYALLSSLFALPRILAGPVAGVLADTLGWRDFFVLTILFGVPGMVMLARFVPWGVREPSFEVAAPSWGPPITRKHLALFSLAGAAVAGAVSVLGLGLVGTLGALKGRPGLGPRRAGPGHPAAHLAGRRPLRGGRPRRVPPRWRGHRGDPGGAPGARPRTKRGIGPPGRA